MSEALPPAAANPGNAAPAASAPLPAATAIDPAPMLRPAATP
jgi:hypothetical protein